MAKVRTKHESSVTKIVGINTFFPVWPRKAGGIGTTLHWHRKAGYEKASSQTAGHSGNRFRMSGCLGRRLP